MHIIRISVRELVESAMKSGSIDNRRRETDKLAAMVAGSRIHRQLQEEAGSTYAPEVYLSTTVEAPQYQLQISGRADGVITDDNGVTVDEIKTTDKDVSKIENPVPVHLAQALVYAYIYANKKSLTEINVRLTYVNRDSEITNFFLETYSIDELAEEFTTLINKYRQFTDRIAQNLIEKNQSVAALEFPFSYREGQRELMTNVYLSIRRQRNLFANAPTGVGKTLSTLFPSIKASAEGYGRKIFYLTAKTITRTAALEAVGLLREKGYAGRVCALTAKDKMCFQDETDCNPEKCPYADGYYDRVDDAIFAIMDATKDYTRDVISEYAETYKVCPFELSLDLTLISDIIVCDYNYAFDPEVALLRFFDEDVPDKDYIFLVDEAHNLVERARSMYSAIITSKALIDARDLVSPYSKKLNRSFNKAIEELSTYPDKSNEAKLHDNVDPLVRVLRKLAKDIDTFQQDNDTFEGGTPWAYFGADMRHFLKMYEDMEDDYRIYALEDDNEGSCVKLLCVQTQRLINAKMDNANVTIFFSATMNPMPYYRSLLSSNTLDYEAYTPSPFSRDHRLLLVAEDTTTKYTERTSDMYLRIARYITKLAQSKTGNYLAFFPSYKFMGEVARLMTAGDVEVIQQTSGMDEEQREQFLGAFNDLRTTSMVGFAVLGGIFSEGVDLAGDRLLGAAIVGTGLPQIDAETTILRNYFDAHKFNGFDYALRFPGMNKVQQAAGRVIRTQQDKGIILLMDSRLLQRDNRQLFPGEWDDFQQTTIQTLQSKLDAFWGNTN